MPKENVYVQLRTGVRVSRSKVTKGQPDRIGAGGHSALEGLYSKPMPPDVGTPPLPAADITSKDYIDRSMDAVRAQNDARFSEVLSEVRSLRDDVKRIPTLWQIFATVVSSMAVAAGLAFAAWAIAGDHFANGMNLADQRQEQLQRDQAQDQRLQETLDRMDAFISSQTSAPQQ